MTKNTKLQLNKTKKSDKHKGHTAALFTKKQTIIILTAVVIFAGASFLFMLSNVKTVKDESYFEDIEPETEYTETDELELGIEETQQEGSKGRQSVHYDVTRNFLTGEEISREYTRADIVTKPINKIIKKGTRKWQYMYCSDGHYWYYTDEQFADKNTGYTHSSPDQCAENNQGVMTELADSPPKSSSWNNNSYSTPMIYRVPSYSYNSNSSNSSEDNSYTPSAGSESNSSNNSTESSETINKQQYLQAKNTCTNKASSAMRSIQRQLGAMGAGGGSVAQTAPQEAYNSTYRDCMSSYGY